MSQFGKFALFSILNYGDVRNFFLAEFEKKQLTSIMLNLKEDDRVHVGMFRFDRPSPHGSAGPTKTAEEVPGGCRRAGEQGRRRDEGQRDRADQAGAAARVPDRGPGEAGNYVIIHP